MTGMAPTIVPAKIGATWFREAKARGERIPTLTAYDYPMAKLLDEAGLPLLLVGDSLGMVVLGYPDTTHVTMEHMVHHTEAVARARPRAMVVADLPYRSYETPAIAVENALRLVEAGANAVKLEGGQTFIEQVRAIRSEGIEVMGHLGMLPQSVLEEGGYRKKGKTPEELKRMKKDALVLQEAGVFAIVLESVVAKTAREVSEALQIPTIGIGSGQQVCDGEILVTHDLLGLFPWFKPGFVKSTEDLAGEVKRIVAEYIADTKHD